MENIYVSVAKQFVELSKKIANNTISLTDIPYDNIISVIESVYRNKIGEKDLYIQLYCGLISKGLEQSDREVISNTILLLAQHLFIFAVYDMQESEINRKYINLFCKLSHMKNCRRNEDWYEKNGEEQESVTPFEGRGVIYSAITGNYDKVAEPEYVSPEYDYILFTDNPLLKSEKWKIHLIENEDKLDGVRLARKIKILGHPILKEYDYSIWIDGNLQVIDDFGKFIRLYRKREPMLCFNHSARECIYDEKKACESLGKDTVAVMEEQMLRYRTDGYPEKNGLIESGILIRDHRNSSVIKVMEDWWKEICAGSKRDQLSFNYVCWKNNFIYDTSDLSLYFNGYIQYNNHL